jgi:hypothetical protein
MQRQLVCNCSVLSVEELGSFDATGNKEADVGRADDTEQYDDMEVMPRK